MKHEPLKYVISLLAGLLWLAQAQAQDEHKTPDCQLTDIQGQTQWLSHYQGQVMYIDFWASWCPPCVKSFPFMNHIQQQYQQQGFKVLAVNLDENPDDAQAFIRRYKPEISVLYDNQGRDCARSFAVQAMPSSYLLDKKGRIRFHHLGFKKASIPLLKRQIEQLLQE